MALDKTKCSNGFWIAVGDRVRFKTPVDGDIDTGYVKNINGAYILITVAFGSRYHDIERYENEILEVL